MVASLLNRFGLRAAGRKGLLSVVGGYRDVKVLGKFSAKTEDETLAMIVEIQIIDAVFLRVKTFMHKPFTIARGDFW